jgi:predicted double-glycine peptidase
MPHLLSTSLIALLCLGGLLSASGPPGIWLDVPFIKQKKDGCGAASVAMVMQYWLQKEGHPAGESADPAHIQNTLYSRHARGIYGSVMGNYFREHNFRSFTFQGKWSDLEQHLIKGRPLIVMLKPGHHAPPHYVVITGLDPSHGLVLVNDPAARKLLKLDRASFEKSWNAVGNWTLLAVARQAIP